MPTEENQCLNCGKPLTGQYCAHCGQKQTNLSVPLKQLLSEFLGNVLTFDSRFFRTFIPLVTKPGFLTVEFNSGHRVQYVPPLRLYLFISFVFFFTLTLLDVKIVKFTTFTRQTPVNTSANIDSLTTQSRTPQKQEAATTGIEWKRRFFAKMKKASTDPEIINRTVANRLPQLMFVMVPVFALFLKLFYLRSDEFYLHHLVFGLHAHSFTFLILLLMVLLRFFTESPLRSVLLLTLPVYLYLGLRRVYSQSAWITILKLPALLIFYLASLTLVLIAVAVVTIYFYE